MYINNGSPGPRGTDGPKGTDLPLHIYTDEEIRNMLENLKKQIVLGEGGSSCTLSSVS